MFAASVSYATTTYKLYETDVAATSALTITKYEYDEETSAYEAVTYSVEAINVNASAADSIESTASYVKYDSDGNIVTGTYTDYAYIVYTNEDSSTVTKYYYKWDSTSGTYVAGSVYGYDMIVYDTGDDVYVGGDVEYTATTGTNGGGADATLTTGTGADDMNYADFIANTLTAASPSNSGGGAIISTSGIKNITGSFIGNVANNSGNSTGGGAIILTGGTISVVGDFIANSVTGASGKAGGGGAIRDAGGILTVTGDFIGNSSTGYGTTTTSGGGAIMIASTSLLTVTGDFISNYTDANGGAIFFTTSVANSGNVHSISGDFMGNTAEIYGGAIAIYNTTTNAANITVDINATTRNVSFTGNTDTTGLNAIYNYNGTVYFNAYDSYSVTVNDGISGSTGTIEINNTAISGSDFSSVYFNNTVSDQTITVSAGTLGLGSVTIDGKSYSADLTDSSLTVNANATLSFVVSPSETTITLGSTTLDSSAIVALDLSAIFETSFDISITMDDMESSDLYSFLTENLDLIFADITLNASTITDDTYAYAATTDYGEDLAKFNIILNENTVTISGMTYAYTAVPEPSTYAMILGVLALGFAYYRRKQK